MNCKVKCPALSFILARPVLLWSFLKCLISLISFERLCRLRKPHRVFQHLSTSFLCHSFYRLGIYCLFKISFYLLEGFLFFHILLYLFRLNSTGVMKISRQIFIFLWENYICGYKIFQWQFSFIFPFFHNFINDCIYLISNPVSFPSNSSSASLTCSHHRDIWFGYFTENFFIYVIYQPQLPLSLSSHSLQPSPFDAPHPTTTPPLSLFIKGRPPIGVNKAWYMKLRQDHAPPPASRLSEATRDGIWAPTGRSGARL